MTNILMTADSNHVALAPEKARRFLTKALDRGLTVRLHTNTSVVGALGWTIESPNPIDDWELWLYFTPGSRGGSLKIHRYIPATSGKAAPTKLTFAMTGIAIDDMGDALDRHHARQAAHAEQAAFDARRDAHAADLSTTHQAMTVVRAVDAGNAAQAAAVQAVKATPAVQPDPGVQAQAAAILAALKANARFAIRAAHRGTLPRNTPTKVRGALVRRGLAGVAGGALTDLGRAVRVLIIN
jgi:hypothetical protein